MVETEKAFEPHYGLKPEQSDGVVSIQAAVSHAAYMMANQLNAAAIITPTESGSSARMVARFRPKQPVVALCTSETVQRQLCAVWGVYPYFAKEVSYSDGILDISKQAAIENGFARAGDRIIIAAGWPIGMIGSTNLIKVEEIE